MPADLAAINNLLDSLSIGELHGLYHEIGKRLKAAEDKQARRQLLFDFAVGDRVVFDHNGQPLFGLVIRLNQRTATVQVMHGQRWRVAPMYLRKVVEGK